MNENAQEQPKNPFSAVNKHTRLIYTPKTRQNVSMTRFDRENAISVKWAHFPNQGLNPQHMMRSEFICKLCYTKTRKTTATGHCQECYENNFNSEYHDYDHDADDYPDYDDSEYDECCPICGGYEFCDEEYHAEYQISADFLYYQLHEEATSCCCEQYLYHCYHVMPNETICVKHAIARCIKCAGVHTILHDENYSIIAIYPDYQFVAEANFRSQPIDRDTDEIPF